MKKGIVYKIVSILLIALLVGWGVKLLHQVYAESADEIVDIKIFDADIVVPTHTHKFEVRFDDNLHWKECTICQPGQTITSLDGSKFGTEAKELHEKYDNGGSYNRCSTYYADNHRRTCNCGWDSGPFLLIHGRPYNFINGENSKCSTNYADFYLRDIEKITYQEYLDKGLNTYKIAGQSCEWSNLKDGTHDGYGWVFCGGLIHSGEGRIGSVRYIEGGNWTPVSKGSTTGRNGELDEMFILLKYIRYNDSRSRAGFINWVRAQANAQSHIKNNIDNPRHQFSNIITKYSNMSDAMFNSIMACGSGYNLYNDTANIHSSGMEMQCPNHLAPGNIYVTASGCYDSNNTRWYSYNNGLECKCDVCGKHHTGIEEYQGVTYVMDSIWDMDPNTSRTCDGHPVKTVAGGQVKLGCTVYHTYTRDSSHGITAFTRVVDAPGFSHRWDNGSTGNFTYSWRMPQDKNEGPGWSWPHYFNLYGGDSTLVVHTAQTATFNDYIDPVAYGYSNHNTSNSYWKVTGNGTPERYSTYAVLDVAFKDDLLYTYNQVSASVYEKVINENGKEEYKVLKQADGNTWVQLKIAPGTNNIWIGQLQILTEVNGEKDIYVKAKDNTSNESGYIPMRICYLDSKGPTIKVSIEYDKSVEPWAETRDVIVEGFDAFGTVLLGYRGDNGGMVSVPTVDGWGKRRYRFTGDLDGDKEIKFYAIDSSGNLSEVSITMSNLDNTLPTISNIDMEKQGNGIRLKVYAHDKNYNRGTNGSGITAYGISMSGEINDIDWTDSTASNKNYQIDKSGDYYFYVKDKLGHISKSKKVNIDLYREKESCNPEIIPEVGKDEYYDKIDGGDFVVDGFTIQNWLKVPESGTETASEIYFKIYYRRNRYDIKYLGNRQTHGETYIQHIAWGKSFKILDNRFERVYKYNLIIKDDSRLDGDNVDVELKAEIEGNITQLIETWKFENWYFDSKNDDNRLDSRTYLPGDEIKADSEHLSLKDGDIIEFSVQWIPGKVKLPNVNRVGSDFIGWFNKEQDSGKSLEDSNIEAKLLGRIEEITLDDLERRHIQNKDINGEYRLYAWFNKKPVFVNIYDGMFFEGQTVSYKDLLELIGVWDYEDNYQELMLNNINNYFGDLLEIVDNDIETDKEELEYLIEEVKENENAFVTDDIKELRIHLKELMIEKENIQKARRKATQEVKVRKLEPKIAKIEYGADINEEYYDPRFEYEVKDYHSDKETSNGLLEVNDKLDYENEFLDTSTKKIGLVRITYQVHDNGIWYTDWTALDNEDSGKYDGLGEDFESDTSGTKIFIPNSDITMEYTRVCQIDFNYNPMLNLQNILEYNSFSFGSSLSDYVRNRQVLRDSEDLQDNTPWWSTSNGDLLDKNNINTLKKLQDSIVLTGITEINFNGTFEHEHPDIVNNIRDEFVKSEDNKDFGEVLSSGLSDKSKILDELGGFKGSKDEYFGVNKNEIWNNITSIGLTFDGYDQFGKCASNNVIDKFKDKIDTSKRPVGYITKYNSGFKVDDNLEDYDLRIYQTPFERTIYLILVNPKLDSELAYIRSKDKVRYINENYLNLLGNTYWGVTGLEDIEKVMDKAEFPDSYDFDEYSGKFNNKTKVKVNDYSK